MKGRTWAELARFGASTVVLRRKDPIVGSVIVTDRCNLNCQHCAVASIRRVNYPFARIQASSNVGAPPPSRAGSGGV